MATSVKTTKNNKANKCSKPDGDNDAQTVDSDTEKSALYERRFQEGYNIYDEMYYQWLQLHHPTYAKQWHKNAIILKPLSTVRTRLDDEPTILKQSQAKVTRKGKGKAPVETINMDTSPICMNPYSSVYFENGRLGEVFLPTVAS